MERNRVRKEGDKGSDVPKGDDTMSLFELWDRISWRAQGNQVREAIQLLREVRLRCWKRNINQVL